MAHVPGFSRSPAGIAARIAAHFDEELEDPDVTVDDFSGDVTVPPTEYSFHVGVSMTATFSGSVSKEDLVKGLRSAIRNSLKSGMQSVSDEFGLTSVEADVLQVSVEAAALDEDDGLDEFGDPSVPQPEADDEVEDEADDEE